MSQEERKTGSRYYSQRENGSGGCDDLDDADDDDDDGDSNGCGGDEEGNLGHEKEGVEEGREKQTERGRDTSNTITKKKW